MATKACGNVAFITGVNGISGSALVEYIMGRSENEWSMIIITSRSPLIAKWQDPRVRFISLDFLEPVEQLTEQMHDLCAVVTHAFFLSYVHVDDFTKLRDFNEPLFYNFLHAIDRVAGHNLQRVCLQTGGKV